MYHIWMFPKTVVPPNHPFLIGFAIIFTIHFGVFPYFRKHPYMDPMGFLASIFFTWIHETQLTPRWFAVIVADVICREGWWWRGKTNACLCKPVNKYIKTKYIYGILYIIYIIYIHSCRIYIYIFMSHTYIIYTYVLRYYVYLYT